MKKHTICSLLTLASLLFTGCVGTPTIPFQDVLTTAPLFRTLDKLKIEEEFDSAANVGYILDVRLNWGVKDLDRSDAGLWDPKKMGKLIWDDNFTVSPKANQEALMGLCVDLRDNF